MTQAKKNTRVALSGVLLLDKPVGLSSNDALIQTKRLLNAMKAGHAGTLDPFATGLLPLCFGEATKFSHDLLEADKTYETVVHLGVATETGDTEGAITANLPVDVSIDQIDAVLAQFRGPITQIPPMYSALKRDGKPLYEYARAGITLERAGRQITIFELTLLSYQAPFLSLLVRCSKGTYIRVLGEDIGRALGCGAHLNALRRTEVGNLQLADAVTLELIQNLQPEQRIGLLKPVDALLSAFEAIQLSDELADRFLHGQRLSLEKEGVEINPEPGRKRVYRQSDNKLLGSAILQEYLVLAPERLIAKTG
ncbi:tRNA pseudouridine55 synthase [Oxalobacteraceae bacterium GrIS 2.11]